VWGSKLKRIGGREGRGKVRKGQSGLARKYWWEKKSRRIAKGPGGKKKRRRTKKTWELWELEQSDVIPLSSKREELRRRESGGE